MNRAAPRSIAQYLEQLRTALGGEDPALIQDALYDAEEYLRAETAAHPDKSEADVLELIASTYGDPEEVAAAYRDTEIKVNAALKTPAALPAGTSPVRRFFAVFSDPRAYTSVFFMLLSLATGIVYFTLTVVGLSISAGLAVLIIGVPFFLAFIGLTRIVSLAEGRLIEAMTGERMPRRPIHPGPAKGFWARIADMLTDWRTWTTLAYLTLMLPLGIVYFVCAAVGLSVSLSLILAPIFEFARAQSGFNDWFWSHGQITLDGIDLGGSLAHEAWTWPLLILAGVVMLTVFMHFARGLGKMHAHYAKSLLVAR